MSLPWDSQYALRLRNNLADRLSKVHRDLGSGTQLIRDDAAASGMNCAKYVGIISGLEQALEAMKEVEKDMSGKATTRKEQE